MLDGISKASHVENNYHTFNNNYSRIFHARESASSNLIVLLLKLSNHSYCEENYIKE